MITLVYRSVPIPEPICAYYMDFFDIDKVCKMFAVYTIPKLVAVLALKLQPLDVGRDVFKVPGKEVPMSTISMS
jgi:hypothetical protein